MVGTHWGTGRHLADLSVKDTTKAMEAWFYCEIFYILATTFIRIAVGAFLLRVTVRRSHRYIIYTLIGINIVFNIYYFFITLFQCYAPSYFWTRFTEATKGRCMDPMIVADSTYAQSGIAAVTDWAFGLLPIAIIWDLNMHKRKKIAVGIVLGLGAL